MPPKKATAAKKTAKATESIEEILPSETKAPRTRKAKQISQLEAAKKKTMYAGGRTNQNIDSYVLTDRIDEDGNATTDKEFTIKSLKYPPALLKIIDEVIVNAIDHHTHYPKLVTFIKISVTNDGIICVYNNGPGIPVEKVTNIQGVEMYMPQLIASEFHAGDNLDDDGDNVKGGTNGIGLKLASAFSEYLILETADKDNKLLYVQKFCDGLNTIEPPSIKPLAVSTKPYTKITFLPNYAEFKLDLVKFIPTLKEILQTRSWQAAAYTDANVYFNDGKIPIVSFGSFCQMFCENLVLETKMKSDKCEYEWDVCFSVSDGKERHMSIVNGVYMPQGGTHIKHIQKQLVENLKDNVEKELKKTGVKFNKNYITNNVFIFMKGAIPSPEFLSQTKEAISDPPEKFEGYTVADSQWKKIWELLEPAIMESFLKKQLGELKTKANRGKVDVAMYKEAKFCRDAKKCKACGLIVTEGKSASGTANTGLLAEASEYFNYDWFGVYSIKGVPINALKESVPMKKKKKGKGKSADDADVEDLIEDAVVAPIKRATAKTATTAKTTANTKTVKAAAKTATTESKSAVKAKSAKALDDLALLGRRVPKKKLINNERILSLIKVLGLDFNKTYENTEIGEKEWHTLRYGFIVGLTDQDLDGFNIFGLLTTFIMTFWPALIKRDFIRRILTPLVRCYPINKQKLFVKEFYTEKEFNTWIKSIGGYEKYRKLYKEEKYYKGLGSHIEAYKEVTQMFKNIDSKISTYVYDKDAIRAMNTYYGDDTKPRKLALATPVTREAIEGLSVPLSQHFEIDTKAYQRDNIIRKLLNCIDGFVQSRRKVFYVARRNGRNEIKVQGLAGKAVAEAHYHHGEASLEQTIVRMAQAYPAARNLPLLLPLGNFGSRGNGYKDYAASRYIYTTINWRLADTLFRKEDEYVLEYVGTGKERAEPKYYVPIIPYVLCENNELPATGWAISIHARDIKAIFKNTRERILGKIDKCKKLPLWNNNFTGTVRKYKNRMYYVGVYQYLEDQNAVHITELPPGIFSGAYLKGDEDTIKKKKAGETKASQLKGIQAKAWVADFEDKTTVKCAKSADGKRNKNYDKEVKKARKDVDITIYLKPGAYDDITSSESKYGNEVFDPFEEYFELKEPIYDRINLVNEKGEVVEYKKYEDVFDDWFQFRKNLYAARVEREIILTDLEIKMLENMQKFSKEHDTYHITNKTPDDDIIVILKKHKYDIFNHTLLDSPKFTAVKELTRLITTAESGASYEYLLRMSYRDLAETAYVKRNDRIEYLRDRMKYLVDDEVDDVKLFTGAKIWLKELDELEIAINEGSKSEWFYGDNEFNFEE